MMSIRFFLPFNLVILILLAACLAGDGIDDILKSVDTATELTVLTELVVDEPEIRQRPDRKPLVYGPRSTSGLQAILGTGDLGIGNNRFGFVLTSSSGFVTRPTVKLVSQYSPIDGPRGEMREFAVAHYQAWPYGNRGLYSTNLAFDRAGRWGVTIEIDSADDLMSNVELFFDVSELTSAPDVGEAAVRSVNKTVHDVNSLSELTTGSLKDEDLYQLTIAEAVDSGIPTVIVFASPAFCINAVCGPQVEVLQRLKDEYGGQAHFVHVDLYANPHEIQGDLSRSTISSAVVEWRLPSTEWTFVVDTNGKVTARFEAFATYSEVKKALESLL